RPAAALLTIAALAWVAGTWRDAVAERSAQPLARRACREAGEVEIISGSGELRAIWRTLVATALVMPPAWETNAVLLLLPLAAALADLASPRAAVLFTAGSAALTLALLPPYFVLGWQRGTAVIAAYVGL